VRESAHNRLCHLANGHVNEALLHPKDRPLGNAVRWYLRREDPALTHQVNPPLAPPDRFLAR
jgi:hypothetical protein